MISYKGFSLRLLQNSFPTFIISLIVLSLLFSTSVNAEEQISETEQKVNEILGQLEQKGLVDVERQLYDMGPEADAVLLEMLKGANILDSDRAYIVITILIARGNDNAVFETLKSQLQDDDFNIRTTSASLITLVYKYAAIRDLADIVTGRKGTEHLDQKAIYESTFSVDEIVEQILEALDSDNQDIREFVVAYLKNLGFDCPNCGQKKKKWQAYFDGNETKDSKGILRYISELFGSSESHTAKRKKDSKDSPRYMLKMLGNTYLFTAGREELDVDFPREIRGLISSPDGKRIAFVPAIKSNRKFDTNLWVMDITANKVTKIQIPGTCYYPAWSPKDDRILIQNTTARGFNICTIKDDGTEFSVWTKSFHAMNQMGQWSPDGKKIGFVKITQISGVNELWVVDLEKNASSRIVKGSPCGLLVSRIYTTWFLSKGDKVVYWDCEGDDKGTVGLYETSFRHPDNVKFFAPLDLNKNHDSMYPSPDGKKLAYSRSYVDLAVYDFGTQEIKEYDLCGIISYIWTPDGKNILYKLQECEDFYMLSLETGESTILAKGSLWGKAFGPGGKSIYYLKWDKQTNRPSIWRIDLDGTNDTRIFPVEGIEYVTVHPTPVLKWAERN